MALELPEIGPFLGRLSAPPAHRKNTWVAVDDLRIALASRLFKLAGAARMAGDAAPTQLTAQAWSSAWHETVVAVTDRLVKVVEARLKQAAQASRYPAKRLAAALLTEADKRALTARLGEGGAPLLASLEELDRLRLSMESNASLTDAGRIDWLDAVAGSARRQESAWRELEAALAREEPLWNGEIATIRNWVRPTWPFWATTTVLYGAAIWVGLVLGGYVAAPAPLQPMVSWIWERL